ncbi:TetR/AcrR family transcriptional regulator [Brevibacillus sp. SYSU BS000544]|uniref:TetR/AcrR family transcriptional regulator n=1 Tax=Brevibacillus sp. SYSU BS000544 TaxID=3416443 RepID=UPI003CE4CEA1
MIQESANSQKASPGRPRSKEVTKAILSTTIRLLEQNGYKKLSMESIAKASGAGKQTLYRWWPTKAALVLEAIQSQCELEIPVPNHGSVRQDLLEYVQNTCNLLNGPFGSMISTLIVESQFDEDISQLFNKEFISSRREALKSILYKGVDRGEVETSKDLDFLADLCYGPIWYRLLNRHAPLDKPFVQEIVKTLLSKN